MSETTNESTTSLILFLVNIEDDLSSGGRVARSVLFVRSGGKHGVVTRSRGGNVPPSCIARSNSDSSFQAGTFDARYLSDGGAFGEGTLSDGVATLITHVLVSTVSAVFNTVTSFAVRNHFFVGADEVSFGARAGGVVACS